MYANFGIRAKQYVDWAADIDRPFEFPLSHRNLLLWFNKMAHSSRFHVEHDMFVRLEERKRNRTHNTWSSRCQQRFRKSWSEFWEWPRYIPEEILASV